MKKIFLSLILVITLNGDIALANQNQEERLYTVVYEHIMSYQEAEIANWISKDIIYFSSQYNVDPLLITALFTQESGFSMTALSPTGAIGIAQLQPETATYLGVNPYNLDQNIEGGIRYFSQQQNTFTSAGAWQLSYAIAAYNAGPGALEKYNGIPPYEETINHVEKIYHIHNRLKEAYLANAGSTRMISSLKSVKEQSVLALEEAPLETLVFFKKQ